MEPIFDDQAVADLEGIFNWMALDRPVTARTIIDRQLKNN